MVRIILLLILFLEILSTSFATDTTRIKRNAFVIEAGGKGPYYSLNFERIFKPGDKLIYSWRAGFSILPDDFSVPLAITAFTPGLQHHLEFSLGITPYLKHYKTFLHKKDLSDKQFYIAPAIGYRYFKTNSKLFLSIGFDPLIFIDPPSDNFWNFKPELRPSAHAALGFLF